MFDWVVVTTFPLFSSAATAKLQNDKLLAKKQKEALEKENERRREEEKRRKKKEEKTIVKGYLSKFTKKLAVSKAEQDQQAAPAAHGSTLLKPGQVAPSAPSVSGAVPLNKARKKQLAEEYALQYGSMTPQAARKKKTLDSANLVSESLPVFLISFRCISFVVPSSGAAISFSC